MATGGGEVVVVVAVAYGRVIGFENRLPWKLPEDLRRFKATTMGHPMVMGRKTFESLGRPLPGRPHVVVTRQAGYAAPEGVRIARDPEEALRAARALGARVFVIGGAELYAATLPRATEVLATLVYAEFPGDAFFPRLDAGWHVAAREDGAADSPAGTLRHSFVRLVRRDAPDGCGLCRARAGLPSAGGSPWDEGFARALRDLARPPREGPTR